MEETIMDVIEEMETLAEEKAAQVTEETNAASEVIAQFQLSASAPQMCPLAVSQAAVQDQGTVYRILSMDVGLRNLGVCILSGQTGSTQPPYVELLKTYDILKHCGSDAKCSSVTKIASVEAVTKFLIDHEFDWDIASITEFVVEGQVRAAPKNIVIMSCLFSWYYGAKYRALQGTSAMSLWSGLPPTLTQTHNLGAIQASHSDIATMYQVPATKKLVKGGKGKECDSHYSRKQQAQIDLCHMVTRGDIGMSTQAKQNYNDAKKRDDMADAILQAIWYVENKLVSKPKGKTSATRAKRGSKSESDSGEANKASGTSKAPKEKKPRAKRVKNKKDA